VDDEIAVVVEHGGGLSAESARYLPATAFQRSRAVGLVSACQG
jgi:hypothetical protein